MERRGASACVTLSPAEPGRNVDSWLSAQDTNSDGAGRQDPGIIDNNNNIIIIIAVILKRSDSVDSRDSCLTAFYLDQEDIL